MYLYNGKLRGEKPNFVGFSEEEIQKVLSKSEKSREGRKLLPQKEKNEITNSVEGFLNK